MQNHYKTLGLTNAASPAEIRRAYRILARRYHPDVNPNGDSEDLFKEIALAYATLSDSEKKQQYDLDLKHSSESFNDSFERARDALKRNQQAQAYARSKRPNTASKSPQSHRTGEIKSQKLATRLSTYNTLKQVIKPALAGLSALPGALVRLQHSARRSSSNYKPAPYEQTSDMIGQVAILELSISMNDAICGMKKTVEISDTANVTRKISVSIPPGVQTGSIVRFRSKERQREEIILVIRVESHPWLSIADRGITMDVPLTFGEALEGGKVQVPSFGDPLLVTVEPGTQSGREVRLKGQGLTLRDGTRGDLYIRFIVKIPDAPLTTEVRGISQILNESYSQDVRADLPKRILDQ